jgi:hypothetical protein
LRQTILYADVMWRRQRLWVFFLLVVGVVMGGFAYTQRHTAGYTNFLIFLAYIPGGLILGGLLLLYRYRSYVEAADGGLKISTFLSNLVIDYQAIRWAKVYPLSTHFEAKERRRYVRTANRQLMSGPALFVKLSGEDVDLDRIRRKLGPQIVSGDVVAVPLADSDAMSWEVTSRLPERAAANMGGRRRGKRRRR